MGESSLVRAATCLLTAEKSARIRDEDEHGAGLGAFLTGRQATSVNFVGSYTKGSLRRPLRGVFLAQQQLFKTSLPDIANGGGMETETDVPSDCGKGCGD